MQSLITLDWYTIVQYAVLIPNITPEMLLKDVTTEQVQEWLGLHYIVPIYMGKSQDKYL